MVARDQKISKFACPYKWCTFLLLRTKNESGEIRKKNILIKKENIQTIQLDFWLEVQVRKCKYANFSLILEGTDG